MTATPTAPPTPAPSAPRGASPTPRGPVLTIVFLCSLGTGGIMNGVYFVARERFGFSEPRNLLLGLSIGAVYLVGAVGVSRALDWLVAHRPGITTRRALVGLLLLETALCLTPWLVQAQWSLWGFAVVYSASAGATWPIIESFLSGGRRGRSLRASIGAFNLTWAAAVGLAFWGMSLLIRQAPLAVIACLGAAHLASAAIALALPAHPPKHLAEPHEPHPPVYRDMLVCFRWLLVMSYVLVCALGPVMPTRLGAIGLTADKAAQIASAWTISRLGVFALMQWWHGWHGRWITPIWACAALLAGFALALMAPSSSGVLVGLSLFGIGLGGIYCAALYYAMEVGGAEVEAGGTHEALIGMGYTVGPLLGLLAWGGAFAGLVPPEGESVRPLMLALAGLVAAAGVCGAFAAVRRARRLSSRTG